MKSNHRSSSVFIAVAITAALIGAAASSTPGSSSPVTPAMSSVFEMHYSQVIPAENVALDCVTAQNGPQGMMLQRCNTSTGYFAELIRSDVGALYQFYSHLGGVACFASPFPNGTVFPAPSYSVMAFRSQTQFSGRQYNVFQYPIGRYFQSMMFDTVTGAPFMTMPGNMNNIQIVTAFSNNSAHAKLFQIPGQCQAETSFVPTIRTHSSSAIRHHPHRHHAHDAAAAAVHGMQNTIHHLHAAALDHTPRTLPVELSMVMPPASVDNRAYFNPVRDQGLCGCCWAFGTSALLEAFENIKNNRTFVESGEYWLSPQSLVDCVEVPHPSPQDMVPRACYGGNPLDALNYVIANGIAMETSYPYSSGAGATCLLNTSTKVFPVQSAFLLPSLNVTAMEAAIATYGGVLTVINDNLNWNFFSGNGVFNDPTCTPGVGHVITLVGYGHDSVSGLDYWIVKNSYGLAWGDAGYMRMAKGVNMCGSELYPFAAVPSSTLSSSL